MRFKLPITIIGFILFAMITQSTSNYKRGETTSQYKGVYLHKSSGKWRAQLTLKGKMQKYGGCFNDELSAAKRINQLCEEMDIPLQNPGIYWIPSQQHQAKENTSQYKGVCWHKESKQWRVHLNLRGEKTRNGGYFKDELDAAKRVNQLCEEMGIPLKNPGMSTIPTQQYRYKAKAKTSQYKGVYFHKSSCKWRAQLYIPETMKKYAGGCFNNELDAAKRVNQLCEEMKIPLQNPGISAIPTQQYQKKGKTSQYKGVYFHTQRKKWFVQMCSKIGRKFGGIFDDELDAAIRVNQLCEELKIPPRNPGITEITNQQSQHEDNQIHDSEGTNPVISSEINNAENDDDGSNKNKRKREKDLIINAYFPVKEYYFYDKYLK